MKRASAKYRGGGIVRDNPPSKDEITRWVIVGALIYVGAQLLQGYAQRQQQQAEVAPYVVPKTGL
jgi:cytochrome c-type biogenesis protein CcmH/NrfF